MKQGKYIVGDLTLHGEMLRHDSSGEHSKRLHLLISTMLEKQDTFPDEYRDILIQALLSCARVIDKISQRYRVIGPSIKSGHRV